MAKVHVFDRSMWNAFAGCEPFEGGEPVYLEGAAGEVDWLLVADRQALSLFVNGGDQAFYGGSVFASQAAAVAALSELREDMTVEELVSLLGLTAE